MQRSIFEIIVNYQHHYLSQKYLYLWKYSWVTTSTSLIKNNFCHQVYTLFFQSTSLQTTVLGKPGWECCTSHTHYINSINARCKFNSCTPRILDGKNRCKSHVSYRRCQYKDRYTRIYANT